MSSAVETKPQMDLHAKVYMHLVLAKAAQVIYLRTKVILF